jgi:hypothetical protein
MNVNQIRAQQQAIEAARMTGDRKREQALLSQFARTASRTAKGWIAETLDGNQVIDPQILSNSAAGLNQIVDLTLKDGQSSIDFVHTVPVGSSVLPPKTQPPTVVPIPCEIEANRILSILQPRCQLLYREQNKQSFRSIICRLINAQIWDRLDSYHFFDYYKTGIGQNTYSVKNPEVSASYSATQTNASASIPEQFTKYSDPAGGFAFSEGSTVWFKDFRDEQGNNTLDGNPDNWFTGTVGTSSWGGFSSSTSLSIRPGPFNTREYWLTSTTQSSSSEQMIDSTAGDIGPTLSTSVRTGGANNTAGPIAGNSISVNGEAGYTVSAGLLFIAVGGPLLSAAQVTTLISASADMHKTLYEEAD